MAFDMKVNKHFLLNNINTEKKCQSLKFNDLFWRPNSGWKQIYAVANALVTDSKIHSLLKFR